MGNTVSNAPMNNTGITAQKAFALLSDAQALSNDDAMSSNSRTKSRMTYVRATFRDHGLIASLLRSIGSFGN